MAASFFTSWALWEKLTFFLALAVLVVFGIGLGKVSWRNRMVKKQGLVDEEKRAKIRQLRSNEQIIQSRKSHDIPFGVRAIQSGIQIDGIWISNTSTPVPISLKRGYLSSGFSDLSAASNLHVPTKSSIEMAQPAVRPISDGNRPYFRRSELGSSTPDRFAGLENIPSSEPSTPSRHRSSYKPRRSSQLRFGSNDENLYHEETLEQLEGLSPSNRPIDVQQRHGSFQKGKAVECSSGVAAEIEPSSGSSSLSNVAFSTAQDQPRQSISSQHFSQDSNSQGAPNMYSSSSLQMPVQRKGDYSPAPLGSHQNEKSDPFATPDNSSIVVSNPVEESKAPLANDLRVSSVLLLPSPPYTTAPSERRESYGPGELHVNKTARRVNSRFEVLPAGTFGTPIEFKGNENREENWSQDDNFDERRKPKKLQKRGRDSVTIGEHTTIMDP